MVRATADTFGRGAPPIQSPICTEILRLTAPPVTYRRPCRQERRLSARSFGWGSDSRWRSPATGHGGRLRTPARRGIWDWDELVL